MYDRIEALKGILTEFKGKSISEMPDAARDILDTVYRRSLDKPKYAEVIKLLDAFGMKEYPEKLSPSPMLHQFQAQEPKSPVTASRATAKALGPKDLEDDEGSKEPKKPVGHRNQ